MTEIVEVEPGRSVVAFDRDFRIIFAEAHELSKRVGRLLSDLLDPETWESLKAAYVEVSKGNVVDFDVTGVSASCSVSIAPLLEDERVVGGIATLRSLTEGEVIPEADVSGFSERLNEGHDRLIWTERINSWIEDDAFVLHGQPIIDVATGATQQAELLLRIRDRNDPEILIPPVNFLPTAEGLGLASKIDRWVVAKALRLAEQHPVEINVSGAAISDPEQVHVIAGMISECDAPRENIIFEISESSVGDSMGSARAFAERIRALGCAIALDKFGVGYGTFTYLKYLPIDYLKIDVEFVRDLTWSEKDQNIVRSIVGAAKLFGMKTIAEGVEDQEALEILIGMGVDLAQGYLIGPPVPTDHLWGRAPA